jgi:hypothetical protein
MDVAPRLRVVLAVVASVATVAAVGGVLAAHGTPSSIVCSTATARFGLGGPGLDVTGQDWSLQWFTDLRGASQQGDYRAAALRIDGGTVQARDLCNELRGAATAYSSTRPLRSCRLRARGT